MPSVFTQLTAGQVTPAGATTEVTASISPTPGNLILACLAQHTSGLSPTNTVPTGCGLTWVQVITANAGAGAFRITVWRAMGAATPGALTFNGLTTTDNSREWAVLDIGNVDTSGTNGSGAIVQSVAGSGTSTALLATLGAFSSTANGTVGFGAGQTGPTLSAGSGFTGMTFQTNANQVMLGEWRTTNQTAVTEAATSSIPWQMIGIEIKFAPTSSTPLDLEQTPYESMLQAPAQTFDPNEFGWHPLTPPPVVAATVAQDAALWPEQPGQDMSLQPVWADPDSFLAQFAQVIPGDRLTFSVLDSGHAEGASATATTAVISPSPNKLILACVNCTSTLDPGAGAAAGNGLTWVSVATRAWQTTTSRIQVFRAMGAAPTPGSIVFTFANTPTAWNWIIIEVGGVDTSGTNGSGAVVQSATGASSSTTALATLGAFSDIINGTFEAVASAIETTLPTVGPGFTAGPATTNAPSAGDSFRVGWKLVNDTSVDATVASGTWGIIGIEIKPMPQSPFLPELTPAEQMVVTTQPTWFAADGVHDFGIPPTSLPLDVQLQAPLWPEQPGQEASLQPVWAALDDVDLHTEVPPGLTWATPAQDAAILPEQPGSEASLQPVWAALDDVAPFGFPTPAPPTDPILQAPLWPEQPGSERSLQPVWFRPDDAEEGIPFGIYPPPPVNPNIVAPLWPEQPGSERTLQPVWFAAERIFDVPLPAGHRRRRTQRVQYHLVVYGPDANGGPGTPKLELDSDALNVTWMQTLNGPGAIAFALYRRNVKADSIEWMVDHVKLFRETDAGLKVVFAGKLVKPVYSAIDVLAYGWDYTAFLQLSRTGYRTAYPSKLIGSEVIGPEWALAKALTNSPFTFVATGTVQDPLGLDGVTPIRTNNDFGMVDFNRLFAFGTVSEMAMANTTNNVKFEITRESPHTFNLWKNYGSNATDFVGTSPGNLASYDFDPGYDAMRHDLATVLSDGHGGHGEYTVQSTDANTTRLRRLQQALVIRTLFGVTSGTTETDQGIAALRRQLAVAARYPRSITSQPRQGEFDPFVTADVGDLQRYTLQNPSQTGDLFDGYVRLVEIVGTFAKNHGELLQLRHRYAQ